jgi:hypothetical protein
MIDDDSRIESSFKFGCLPSTEPHRILDSNILNYSAKQRFYFTNILILSLSWWLLKILSTWARSIIERVLKCHRTLYRVTQFSRVPLDSYRGDSRDNVIAIHPVLAV